jgi:carboxymethylenebutenolidase
MSRPAVKIRKLRSHGRETPQSGRAAGALGFALAGGTHDKETPMCHELDSEPPIPVIAGAAVAHEDLVLEAADANRFAAFLATPDEPSALGVVILPDVRGLYHFYEELALRFAERGYAALAIDYFGRTAGVAKRDESFEAMEHTMATTPEGVQADIAAAVAYLRSPAGGSRSAIFTVGFCFGGANSWLAAAGGHGLAGAVGFYGMPGPRGERPGPIDSVEAMSAPILALQGGADAHITPEINEAFDAALDAAGVEHEVVTFPDAPHSFFDRHHEEFQATSEEAWQRTLDFIDAHSGA